MAGMNNLGYTTAFSQASPFSYNASPLAGGNANPYAGNQMQQGFQGNYNMTGGPAVMPTPGSVQQGTPAQPAGNPFSPPDLSGAYQQQLQYQSQANQTQQAALQQQLAMQQQLVDFWMNRQLPDQRDLKLIYEAMAELYNQRPKSEGIYMIGY